MSGHYRPVRSSAVDARIELNQNVAEIRAAAGIRRHHLENAGFWALAAWIVVIATVLAFLLLPKGVHFPRPQWVLHPDETSYLITAKHLAETGRFVIEDDWYKQGPTHLPPGTTLSDGKLVPRKGVGGYLAYAGAYLVSDSGWLYVGPIFGLLAAIAAGVLVYQRAQDKYAAGAALLILGTSSPFIAYATGLAFADVIAVACILWSWVFLFLHLEKPSILKGLATAAFASLAVLTRLDFAAVVLLMGVASLFHFWREKRLVIAALSSLPAFVLFLAAIAALLVANDTFYGSPFRTGYHGGWQESPAGVAGSFTDISLRGLVELFGGYLVKIGLPSTVLLIIGLSLKNLIERHVPSQVVALDFVFLGAVAFALVYFLGRPGAYGTGEVWLVSSYPRYILHVYAIGVIWGIEGLSLLAKSVSLPRRVALAVLTSVTVLAISVSLREAFQNERGVAYIEPLSEKHHEIARLAETLGESPIVISDLSSKAVIDGRTITPGAVEGGESSFVAEVIGLLASGERVLVIRDQPDHPLYSGYVERLVAGGVQLQRWRCEVAVYEAFAPDAAAPASDIPCPLDDQATAQAESQPRN